MSVVRTNRAYAEIHLGALQHNVRELKSQVNSRLMIVVKADGYGHGAVPVALAAREAGADWLGVAYVDEALDLRNHKVGGPILAWLLSVDDNFEDAISENIDLSVATVEQLEVTNQVAEKLDVVASIHVEIDTGLSRSGVAMKCLSEFFEALQHMKNCKVISLWSHLAASEDLAHNANKLQIDTFNEAVKLADVMGISYEFVHLANSAATLLSPELHFGMVRCGIAAYGVTPGGDVGDIRAFNLEPVMRVVSEIAQVRRVEAGAGASYNHTWISDKPTTLGLVPLGYADGIPRNVGNKASITYNNKQYPIVGTVCMDQFIVDFGDDEIKIGDQVEIFGHSIDAHTFHQTAGGIGYELVTRIGARLEKRFMDTHL
ncbi:MAG: alanine racemase [Actinomycetota bacterium]